jgi:hypothetical protein
MTYFEPFPHNLCRQAQLLGTYYDIQWLTCGGVNFTNKILWWDNPNLTQSITSVQYRAQQVVGAYVSKYGVTTKYTAGYIESLYTSLSYVPNSQNTFIKVDNTAGYPLLADSGDSGGPWFAGNTALGSHCAHDATGDAYYMAIDYLAGIGVSVVTS